MFDWTPCDITTATWYDNTYNCIVLNQTVRETDDRIRLTTIKIIYSRSDYKTFKIIDVCRCHIENGSIVGSYVIKGDTPSDTKLQLMLSIVPNIYNMD